MVGISTRANLVNAMHWNLFLCLSVTAATGNAMTNHCGFCVFRALCPLVFATAHQAMKPVKNSCYPCAVVVTTASMAVAKYTSVRAKVAKPGIF